MKAHSIRIFIAAALLALGSAGIAAAEDRIQLAILLDTSNSMDGLISQAKTQLWNVVNELARTKRHGKTPALEVALFEYGNDGLPESEGYIRLVSNLTTDLDRISEELFRLTTNGGSEYCGMVIDRAVDRLAWSKSREVMKMIYIAGNEPFTQGPVAYAGSCGKAARRDIIVNTVFCGSNREGIETSWRDGALKADGRYASIDSNEAVVEIETPFDKEILGLGGELDKTYLGYGARGDDLKARQAAQDENAASMGQGASVQRSVAKAQPVYANESWDLVDAVKSGSVSVAGMKKDELPAELRSLAPAEREAKVKVLIARRAELQEKINAANEKRRLYVAAEMKKRAAGNTLGQAILDTVKEEAVRKGFTVQ